MQQDSYRTFGTRKFKIPGVIKLSRTTGVTWAPPTEAYVQVREETTINSSGSVGSGLYQPVFASLSMNVEFYNVSESYRKSIGGADYCFRLTTSADSTVLAKGSQFMGNKIWSSNFEKHGDSSQEFYTRIRNPLSRTSTLIYSKNNLKIFKCVSSYISSRINLPNV